ncbi:MAG TPA: insulinase family protein [Firmicutes bacterium]|nr:insulinase family protein [Bacillota bacterium]
MYQKTRLDNGIEIVTEQIPYVRSVTVGFWFKAGSRHEPPELNGASHLIEHMIFKGTKERSAKEIAEEIDAAGGQLNAFTDKEYTCYYARVLDCHFELAVEILADMILHSTFHEEELKKEKGVVLEEIHLYEDTPDEVVHDLFAAAALEGHPLAQGILGTAENIKAIEREELLNYMHKCYTAGNMVVAVAGNVTHERVTAAVAANFAEMKAAPNHLSTADFPCQMHQAKVIKSKDTEQVHVCLGSLSMGRKSNAKYALYVLDMALGGSMSSRLFQKLREERGLVYATYSYHTLFQDNGLFTVYAGTGPQHAPMVVELMQQELARVAEEGIRQEELDRAKEQLKGSFMLSMESTSNRMNYLAKCALSGDEILNPDQWLKHIDRVQIADVHEVAAMLLRPECQVLAAVGPINQNEI